MSQTGKHRVKAVCEGCDWKVETIVPDGKRATLMGGLAVIDVAVERHLSRTDHRVRLPGPERVE
ncbi:MAG: hypothetical protein AB7I04_18310 [Pseudomonadales bacterium]